MVSFVPRLSMGLRKAWVRSYDMIYMLAKLWQTAPVLIYRRCSNYVLLVFYYFSNDIVLNTFADGCPAETDQIAQGVGIHLRWNESDISSNLSQPCPCKDIIAAPANATVSRKCGGTYSEGASWDEVDYSQCRFTSITLKLCEASLVSGCRSTVFGWSTDTICMACINCYAQTHLADNAAITMT